MPWRNRNTSTLPFAPPGGRNAWTCGRGRGSLRILEMAWPSTCAGAGSTLAIGAATAGARVGVGATGVGATGVGATGVGVGATGVGVGATGVGIGATDTGSGSMA